MSTGFSPGSRQEEEARADTALSHHDGQRLALTTPSPFDVQVLLADQLTQSSRERYRREVAASQAFAASPDLDPLNPQTLATWRDDLALRSTMSPNTITRMISAGKRVVKQAASKDMVSGKVAMQFETLRGVKVKALKTVVLQKFLSSSKRNVFYNRTKVKRVKDVPIFSRRICFGSNYTIIFDELKNFATQSGSVYPGESSTCERKAETSEGVAVYL